MPKLTQNSVKTPKIDLEDSIVEHILATVNHAIFMFNKRSTMHFFVYCEEQLTTLLPLARILTKETSKQVADQIENTIDLMQRGEDISEITLGEG
jgi:hypothetical protein